MWIQLFIVVLFQELLARCTGDTISTFPGEKETIQWTMDPVPPSSAVVTVLHPSKALHDDGTKEHVTLFSAMGTMVLPIKTELGDRVINTGNTNTYTGHIEFTLTGIKVEDAGVYRARYVPASGSRTIDSIGETLVVYANPSKPNITVEAESVINRTMVLNCSTISNTRPEGYGSLMVYDWYMNDADLPSDDRYIMKGSELHVKNIKMTDENTTFTCKAYENTTMPSDVSEEYTVEVKYGPNSVSLNQKLQYSFVEDTDTLGPIKCSANCEPTCVYQWKFNGEVYDESNDTLTINNINRTSAGTYWCVASNDYGSETSNHVSVDVKYGPGDILFTPNNRSYVLVEKLRDTLGPIICHADCNPTCSYRWTSNELDIQGDTLIINTISRDKAGLYKCIVTSSLGDQYTQTSSISVTVEYGPGKIHLSPRNTSYTLVEKDTTLGPISCVAVCLPKCSYSWTLNNKNKESSLMAERITANRTMAGRYNCTAYNIYGTSSVMIDVVVEYKPDKPILSKSIPGDIMENGEVSLTCTTDSVPSPEINITLMEVHGKSYVTHRKLDSTLTIQRADCLDTGQYICSSANKIGSSSSSPVAVNVTCSPRLGHTEVLQKDVYIGDGDILDTTITLIANPPPVLSWIFLNDTNDVLMLQNNTDGFIYYEDTNLATHTLRAVKSQMHPEDFGEYTLKAYNYYGNKTISFNVLAKRSPDPPYDGRVACSGQTAATLTWRSNFNGGDKQIFTIKSTRESGTQVDIADRGMNVLHEARVDNLKAGTFYSFELEAHNRNGKSNFEHLLNCTTKPLRGTSSAVIGGAVGGCLAFVVIISIIGGVLFIKRRKQEKGEDIQLVNRGQSKMQNDYENNYENVVEEKFEDESIGGDTRQVTNESDTSYRRKNKDGLTYIDVDVLHTEGKVVVNGKHGADKKVEYVDIDFTQLAESKRLDDVKEK